MDNNNSEIDISVIMPTYNSEKTIEASLKSIRDQKYDQKRVEILVIDGGSNDQTIFIAEKYNARILINEKRQPEAAKTIGIQESKGNWGAFLDSDESYLNLYSFQRRMDFFKNHPEVKYIATSGILNPENANGVVRYTNYIGDPFSNFVYQHYNGYDRIQSVIHKYHCDEDKEGIIIRFQENDQLPLYDAKGDFFELDLARKCYDEANDKENVAATLYDRITSYSMCSALLKDDAVCHDSRMQAKIFRSKLRWRILNNLFGSDSGVGFETRKNNNRSNILKKRQLLWVLYSASVVGPMIEGGVIALKNKDAYFLKHILWNEYVFIMIIYYSFRKVFHLPPAKMKKYG
ncbi:glycosyltransferase [Butyrivibrio fibrisolvens]|uniref:glycosyltransferase n=1 Tax=Butyrivibrio fibrisolvens TaxID=831 RepID=UPI0003FD267C|nr:glycosyltransferase [Butyrivibrio fibrisolvens]